MKNPVKTGYERDRQKRHFKSINSYSPRFPPAETHYADCSRGSAPLQETEHENGEEKPKPVFIARSPSHVLQRLKSFSRYSGNSSSEPAAPSLPTTDTNHHLEKPLARGHILELPGCPQGRKSSGARIQSWSRQGRGRRRFEGTSFIVSLPFLNPLDFCNSFPTLALSGGSTGLYQSKPELNIVTIDVGGQIFQTTKQTLALAGPSSLLSDSDPSQLATVFGPPSKCADLSSSASVSHAITVNTLRRNFLSHFMGS
ncbi:hypothetical protein CRG98_005189 [Punica granatum]|uniref:Potassium channel tetramerisation-type BTB domain-containing protein n=1 Tax=Punica granatum TaxID=22663 RepID=A0A2I0L131_PUNGR|nr:hypothetical protein CRG98_005189 [Punica granatum]